MTTHARRVVAEAPQELLDIRESFLDEVNLFLTGNRNVNIGVVHRQISQAPWYQVLGNRLGEHKTVNLSGSDDGKRGVVLREEGK